MTPGVAGPGAFTQAQQQLTADMGGLGDISRDATGQISGFTGGTGIASFQPYLQSIQDKKLLRPNRLRSLYVTVSTTSHRHNPGRIR